MGHGAIHPPGVTTTSVAAPQGEAMSDVPDGAGAADPNRAGGNGATPDTWAVDAALGIASLFARTVGAVGGSAPGRAVTEATRMLAQPLSREGHDVREVLGEEATPTARRLVAQVTPRVAEVVDLNEILAGIDLDRLLEHIDLDRLLARIDLDSVLARVDLDAVVQRIDLTAVMAGVDVEELVANTEIGGLLALSSSSVVSRVLDVVRSWVVGLDEACGRIVDRVLGRDASTSSAGPPSLLEPRVVASAASAAVDPVVGVA
jgi:hypothetical protein